MQGLTAAQVEKLLAFRGYGNRNAPFWFVGMEEGGSSNAEDLRIRADRFSRIEDLAESHKHFKSHDMAKLTTSTWRLMSSIVGHLKGESNWWDREFAREYQTNHLGRLDGETYLTEILPLPKKGINDWPYGDLFDSPTEYRDQVLPARRELLRKDHRSASPKPRFVFCYGKSFWHEHRAAFDFIDFQPAMDGTIDWGRNEHTVFVLTKFFGWWFGFNEEFVDRLCEFAMAKSPRRMDGSG